MNNSITRERLEKIKSWRETYGAGSNVMLPAEEAEELASIALAAMDSEPVAEVCEDYAIRYISNGPAPKEGLRPGDKLYRHAQRPVVPNEITSASAPEVFEVAAEAERLGLRGTYASSAVGWNACRSAMLAAAPQSPGSEPATVPGKWIPVSERMPEAGGDMIVFADGIVMSGVSYAKKKGFYIQALEYDDDEPVDSVTHWMPLPAAPQEVSDA